MHVNVCVNFFFCFGCLLTNLFFSNIHVGMTSKRFKVVVACIVGHCTLPIFGLRHSEMYYTIN